MNVQDDELLARLAATDAARPVPAGRPITLASLHSHARRRAARTLLVATALVTALGLPLLFRSAPTLPDAPASPPLDVATELRVLRAQLDVLQRSATQQQLAAATRRSRAADATRAHTTRFELAAVRADALRHRQPVPAPETHR